MEQNFINENQNQEEPQQNPPYVPNTDSSTSDSTYNSTQNTPPPEHHIIHPKALIKLNNIRYNPILLNHIQLNLIQLNHIQLSPILHKIWLFLQINLIILLKELLQFKLGSQ